MKKNGDEKGKKNNKINRGDRGMVRNGGYGRRENEEVGGVVKKKKKIIIIIIITITIIVIIVK